MLFAVLAVALLANTVAAAQPNRPKNVLLLYSFSERNFFDSADSLDAGVWV